MFHQKSCFYQKPCFYQKLCFHPSHLKVPIELLYLESSTIPLNYILAGRRINYLHNMISMKDNELIKQIYPVFPFILHENAN